MEHVSLGAPVNPFPQWQQWCAPLGRFVPIVAGAATDETEGDGEPDKPDTKADEQTKDDTGTGDDSKLTQAEVDKIVEKRLGQAKKAWEKDAADAKAKAEMTEAERLKAEKADAEKAADERNSAANARIIRSEAKVAAVAAGVKPDRVQAFLRIVDLDDVELDDDGDPNPAALKAAIDTALKTVPEFAVKATGGASAGEHNSDPKNKPKDLAAAVAAHYAT